MKDELGWGDTLPRGKVSPGTRYLGQDKLGGGGGGGGHSTPGTRYHALSCPRDKIPGGQDKLVHRHHYDILHVVPLFVEKLLVNVFLSSYSAFHANVLLNYEKYRM